MEEQGGVGEATGEGAEEEGQTPAQRLIANLAVVLAVLGMIGELETCVARAEDECEPDHPQISSHQDNVAAYQQYPD
jgi:hypothetical protein